MSIRSWISIEVDPKDVGTYRHHDPKLLHMKLEVEPSRKHAENDFPMVKLSQFLSTYCHHDGFPNGVGRVLLENYNTYEKVLNLILGGYYSCLIGTPYSWNGGKELEELVIRSYYLLERYGERGVKLTSDQIWAQEKPRASKTMEGADPYKVFPKGNWIPWAYLWKDNKWWVKQCFSIYSENSSDWFPLTEEYINKYDY